MGENERQKSTARPWHINGASEAGRRRRGGLYSAAAPQWADTGECRRHTATPSPPHTHSSNRGRNGRCPTGNFYRRRSSDMKSSIGSRGPERDRRDQIRAVRLFVQQIGDDQRCSRHGVRRKPVRLRRAAEDPCQFSQVC